MSTNPGFENLLEKVDPARRDIVRKLLLGTAVYSAPLVLSYSMDSLEGTARAQSQNQTISATPVPATSGWTLTALAGALAAAGAILIRRRGEK
jgi:hypothetical protein